MGRADHRPASPRGMKKRRAVFLDRDGTLNRDVGYPAYFGQIHLYPSSVESVRKINHAGLAAVVVTHQSGVGRGYFSEDELLALHREFTRRFAENGARIDRMYYCPHDRLSLTEAYRRDCDCAKPRPGLGLLAAAELGLDLPGSYMVGDKTADVLFGRNIGATPVLLLTGYGKEARKELESRGLPPDHIAADVGEAVAWILDQEKGR